MRYGAVLAFVAGTVLGVIIGSVHSDETSKKKETVDEKKDDKADSNKENGYKEKTSIDDYKPYVNEDLVAYDNVTKQYDGSSVDPAETESPEEDDYEEKRTEDRVKPTVEISKAEFGTYGYDTIDVYYDSEHNFVWEDGAEPFDDSDVVNMFGHLLECGFDSEDKKVMYIRNFRLMTDFAVFLYIP